jgi:Arc/MetJ family transcription regulator
MDTDMRTNIEIDDRLLADAMAASGKKTKKDTVHEALELLVRIRSGQTALRALRGKIDWEGDLDAMRRD